MVRRQHQAEALSSDTNRVIGLTETLGGVVLDIAAQGVENPLGQFAVFAASAALFIDGLRRTAEV